MNQFNGRVNILQPNTNTLFNMYDKIPAKVTTDYRNPTTGIFEKTPLIDKYFSKNNIQSIYLIKEEGISEGVVTNYLDNSCFTKKEDDRLIIFKILKKCI